MGENDAKNLCGGFRSDFFFEKPKFSENMARGKNMFQNVTGCKNFISESETTKVFFLKLRHVLKKIVSEIDALLKCDSNLTDEKVLD